MCHRPQHAQSLDKIKASLSKPFFFEKKNQKTSVNLDPTPFHRFLTHPILRQTCQRHHLRRPNQPDTPHAQPSGMAHQTTLYRIEMNVIVMLREISRVADCVPKSPLPDAPLALGMMFPLT
jgi:hypothetical protein